MRPPSIDLDNDEAATARYRLIRNATAHSVAPPLALDELRGLGEGPRDIMQRVSLLRRYGLGFEISDEKQVSGLLTVLSHSESFATTKRTSDLIQRKTCSGTVWGRPRSMTPERKAIAARMLMQGKRGKSVLAVVRACKGPSIGQSAYYLWQKAWLDKNVVPDRPKMPRRNNGWDPAAS